MTKLKRHYVSDEGGSESNAKRLKRRGKGKALQEDKDPFFIGDLKKGKGKVAQVDCEEMRELQKREEEDAFFRKLKKNRKVTSAEIEFLKDANITSCDLLMSYYKENPKVKGITELRLHQICRIALETGKVKGINLLLKETAFAKKQNFVVVRSNTKGLTEELLTAHFRLFNGFKRVELRKKAKYGFVFFVTRNNAERAANVMDGNRIGSHDISVRLDREGR